MSQINKSDSSSRLTDTVFALVSLDPVPHHQNKKHPEPIKDFLIGCHVKDIYYIMLK